jgi:hypothetical protein
MKYLKNFNRYNESILGDIQRLNPRRRESDKKGKILFSDIKEDYLKNDKDLRKVNIIDDGGNSISLDSIVIGKYYTLSYVFGKYHPVYRSNHSGNREAGDRRIRIVSIPFSFTIRKNELEKAFKTDRIKLSEVRVSDTKTKHNYNRNPNIGNHALYIEDKDEYKISSDVANEIFNFFIGEFNKKYHQLSKSKYKGELGVRDIQKGVNPTLKYISTTSKDGKHLSVPIRYGDDEKEIINKVKNMTEKEYKQYYKSKNEEIYKKSSEESNKKKNKIEQDLDKFFKSIDIDLSEEITEWEKYGFYLKSFINDYEFLVEFKYKDDISDKLKSELKKFEVNGYKGELKRVSDGWSDKTYKYYLIEFTK